VQPAELIFIRGGAPTAREVCYNSGMLSVLWLSLGSLLRIYRNRQDLIFENLVL